MKSGFQSPKNSHNQILGRLGEQRAVEFLESKGFVCLGRNWRCRAGEIDIIVKRGTEIHFVEVKTRITKTYGTPEEAVSAKKILHLRRAAERWIELNPLIEAKAFQYDVISLYRPGRVEEELLFIENAF